jgi:hypothetical protein
VGKSEVAEKSAMLALRYNGAKEPWQGDVATFGAFVAARLELIQAAMLAKATQERNAKLKVVRFLFFLTLEKDCLGFGTVALFTQTCTNRERNMSTREICCHEDPSILCQTLHQSLWDYADDNHCH